MSADPIVVENADGAGAWVIVCDHASNRFPPEYGQLGLPDAFTTSHAAWDPGALGVSQVMSTLLDAPLIWPDVSRLVLDCNRELDAPDIFRANSEGTDIPGNLDVSEADRSHRIATVHGPFHEVIDECLDARAAAFRETRMIAMHTYTPVFHGKARPWEIGILFGENRRLADILIHGLERDGDLSVGVNEPYSPADGVYYTLSRHGEARGLDTVMVEIRNDEVASPADERKWTERLAAILQAAED